MILLTLLIEVRGIYEGTTLAYGLEAVTLSSLLMRVIRPVIIISSIGT
jgi:hypothetical protein